MDSPNPQLIPLARPLGPSEAEAIAARRSLNRWRMGCMIVFTLVLAAGVSTAFLAAASGVVYRALEWTATAGLLTLSLPVIFGCLRWNRALGRTLISVGILLFFVAALIAVRNSQAWANESLAVFGVGLLLSSILLLGGVRIRKAVRVIRDSDPPLAPVRSHPVRDLVVVLVSAAVGTGLAYRAEDRVRDLAQIRTRRTCAENLFAVASALRDYQAIYGVRPPTLNLLVGTTSLRLDALACSVLDAEGQPVPFTYCPEAGVLRRDIVACDTADAHGPRWINILTGNGIVSRSPREKVEGYLAFAAVSSIGERMAESLERGEPTIDDLKALIPAAEAITRPLSPQQQADIRLFTHAALELAQEQEAADAAYLTAIEAFEDVGGIDAVDLTSREAIRDRLELLAEARRRHELVLKLAISTVDDLTEKVGAEVIPRLSGQGFIAHLEETQRIASGMESAEAGILDLSESVLKLLDEAWGQWEHDEEDDALFFEADEHLERYDALIGKIDELTKRQAALREQLITQIRERSQRLRAGR